MPLPGNFPAVTFRRQAVRRLKSGSVPTEGMFVDRRGTSMTSLASLCAFALLAVGTQGGTISITTTSPEAAADYVEA